MKPVANLMPGKYLWSEDRKLLMPFSDALLENNYAKKADFRVLIINKAKEADRAAFIRSEIVRKTCPSLTQADKQNDEIQKLSPDAMQELSGAANSLWEENAWKDAYAKCLATKPVEVARAPRVIEGA